MRKIVDLTPQEVLSLAIAIEQSNAENYHEWSKRIQSYSTAAATLFNAMASEEREHELVLRERFEECFDEEMPARVEPEAVESRLERPVVPREHYFVYDDNFAQQIYAAALQSERGARDFYRHALANTDDPRLLDVFENLAAFEDEHVQILEETLINLRRSGQSRQAMRMVDSIQKSA